MPINNLSTPLGGDVDHLEEFDAYPSVIPIPETAYQTRISFDYTQISFVILM